MGPTLTTRTRNFLALGSTLIILSVFILYRTYGSGNSGAYFPPHPIYFTWPMLVLGGGLFGYAIADQASDGESRPLRISLALIGANIGWIGQTWMTARLIPAADLFPSIENSYPIGIPLAVITVLLVELSLLLLDNPRLP